MQEQPESSTIERAMAIAPRSRVRQPRVVAAATSRPERVQSQPLDRDYWLAHCEGYRVDAGRRRIGFVQKTLDAETEPGRPLLVVRGGRLGRRLFTARPEDVVAVVPRELRLWLRSDAPLTQTASR